MGGNTVGTMQLEMVPLGRGKMMQVGMKMMQAGMKIMEEMMQVGIKMIQVET